VPDETFRHLVTTTERAKERMMRYCERRIAFLALLCFLAVAGSGAASGQAEEQAVRAAERWLALVDKGDFSASWDEASELFKAAVTKEQWRQSLTAARKPLGELASRKLRSRQYATTLPGAPDGEYVVIQYETSFRRKREAVETVTPMRDRDGTWRVSGYFIK